MRMRVRAGVGAAAVAVAVALTAGHVAAGAAPVPRRPAAADPMLAVVAQVERVTEGVRGLHATRPVPAVLLAPAAFNRVLARDIAGSSSPDEPRVEAQTLTLLGLLSPRADPRRVLTPASDGGVVAFYDPGGRRFFLARRAHDLSLDDRVTIAHEYTHALQDQAFGLDRVRPPDGGVVRDSDRALAETALIEGDATVTMALYAQAAFTQQQYVQWLGESSPAPSTDGTKRGADTDMPRYLRDLASFPYDAGMAFEQTLLDQGLSGSSFDRVDAAFHYPPASTRQILHPELYRQNPAAPAPDLPPPSPGLSREWQREVSDVMGEYGLRDMLAQRLDEVVAGRVAAGWRADRYTLFDHGADTLLAWRLRLCASGCARDLLRALDRYWSRLPSSRPLLIGGMALRRTETGLMAARVQDSDALIVVASRGVAAGEVLRALSTMG